MKILNSRIVAAFAVLYLVWGSTYLAIRVALEAWPPFLLAGSRFLVAGLILLVLALRSGSKAPTRREWAGSALTGALFFLGGNGLVCWAEQEVASGIAALAVATVPVWMTVIPAPGQGRKSVSGMTWLGVAVGLGAVALLALPGGGLEGRIPTLPLLALLAAAVCWAAGSHLTLRVPHPSSPFATAGAQMICGGLWATLAGSLGGEWKAVDLAAFTSTNVSAWAYLVVFGSVLALSAYSWLLRKTTPAAVGTYAFVNPVVAVLLGWALGGEVVGLRTLLSLALVVLSVVLILRGRRAPRPATGRLSLRTAALLAAALLLPATSDAGSTCCSPDSAAPALRLRDAATPWAEKERLAAEADLNEALMLFALAETAWDPREDWRVRLTAVATLLRSPAGRDLLRVFEHLQGPLVIETPHREFVLQQRSVRCLPQSL